MHVFPNHEISPARGSAPANIDALIAQLPEQELWRLLQDIIDEEIELGDDTVRRLDDSMQGFLFVQDYVTNRAARIGFACSPKHMPYLRDAAGSRNVWMNDEEFTRLVNQDDSATLACFARSEDMLPHHLAYIEYKLARDPHGQDLLATSYDTRITLKKALECQGNTRETALFRLAKAAVEGSADFNSVVENHAPGAVVHSNGDPRALWGAYLNLKGLGEETIRKMLEAAGEQAPFMSTGRPTRTSSTPAQSVH